MGKILEEDGWFVDWKIKPRFTPRGYNVDYWNLFDLLAWKRKSPIRWIAVKGKSGGYSELRKRLKKFWMPENNIKELWRFPKGLRGDYKIEIC